MNISRQKWITLASRSSFSLDEVKEIADQAGIDHGRIDIDVAHDYIEIGYMHERTKEDIAGELRVMRARIRAQNEEYKRMGLL